MVMAKINTRFMSIPDKEKRFPSRREFGIPFEKLTGGKNLMGVGPLFLLHVPRSPVFSERTPNNCFQGTGETVQTTVFYSSVLRSND